MTNCHAEVFTNHPRKQRGFTLLEAMVILFGAMIIAVAMMPDYNSVIGEERSQQVVQETTTIGESAKAWLFFNGTWPDQANGCVDAINVMKAGVGYLAAGIDGTNPYGTAYVTSCTADAFSITQDVDQDWAGLIVNMLPVTQASDVDTIVSAFPPAGAGSGLRNLLYNQPMPGNPAANTMDTDLRYRILQDVNTVSVTGTSTFGLEGTATVPVLTAGTVDTRIQAGANAGQPGDVRLGGTQMLINDGLIECGDMPGPQAPNCQIGFTGSATSTGPGLRVMGDMTLTSGGGSVRIEQQTIGIPATTTTIIADDVRVKVNSSTYLSLTDVQTTVIKDIRAIDFSTSVVQSVPLPSCPLGFSAVADSSPRVSSFCQDDGADDAVSLAYVGTNAVYTYTPPGGTVCTSSDYPKGFVYLYCAR